MTYEYELIINTATDAMFFQLITQAVNLLLHKINSTVVIARVYFGAAFHSSLDVTKTGNGEPGTGNGERESGNECTAVIPIRIQNRQFQSRTQSLQAFWSAGQRREDSGDIEFYYRRISVVKQWKPLRNSQSKKWIFSLSPESSRRCPADQKAWRLCVRDWDSSVIDF